ncbi:MAG: hypothetical protein WC858_04230 [Parcubacteria group bacterium]|jgi:hypothetical protein
MEKDPQILKDDKDTPNMPMEVCARNWAKLALAAGDYRQFKLAQSFDESREEGYRNLEKMDLPRFKSIRVDLATFLNDPAKYFDQIETEAFYIAPVPKSPEALRPPAAANLTREEVLAHVRTHIEDSRIGEFDIKIFENPGNICGGNIVIDAERNIYLEFRFGLQNPIAAGTATPKYTVKNDYTRRLIYDFEDPELRSYIYSAIKETGYMPGYFEFAIIKRDNGKVEPLFIDYRKNLNYMPHNKGK